MRILLFFFLTLLNFNFCPAQDSIRINGQIRPKVKQHPLQKIRHAEIVISDS